MGLPLLVVWMVVPVKAMLDLYWEVLAVDILDIVPIICLLLTLSSLPSFSYFLLSLSLPRIYC